MKKIVIPILLGFIMACQTDSQDVRPESKVICANQNTDATKAKAIQQELDELTKNGLVGLAVHIETPKFSMSIGSGMANIEDKLAMNPCHLQHTASIYKTYLAVVILQMANEGKFDIGDKISDYLDLSLLEKLPKGLELTIEQLLSHRSGLKDVFEVDFLIKFFNNRSKQYSAKELLGFLHKSKAASIPGSEYYYSDANFILLTLLADKFESNYFQQRIIQKTGLQHTYFLTKESAMPTNLSNSYEDKFGIKAFENISDIQFKLTSGLEGSDGFVTTPNDMTQFMKAIFQGKLLSNTSLQKMKSTKPTDNKTAENERVTGYGLGLMEVKIGKTTWLGHFGNHVGSGAIALYSPEHQIYLSAFTNTGTFFSDNTKKLFFYDLIQKIENELIKVY